MSQGLEESEYLGQIITKTGSRPLADSCFMVKKNPIKTGQQLFLYGIGYMIIDAAYCI